MIAIAKKRPPLTSEHFRVHNNQAVKLINMCGIAGIIGNLWQVSDVQSMVDSQRHRGPDGEGIYVDPSRKAALGHCRLSIIDRSEASRQPMVSSAGNLVITYNGEVYNYLELRRELASGYDFKTNSDTEVVLAAFEKWGEGCLDHLIGMFAFVIWDEKTKSTFAARDRFGVKPFYYHRKHDGTFVFASEIKAIHAAGVPRKVNRKAWSNYLTYGLYDHSTETFWQDIFSLPGGHFLKLRDGNISISKWYDLYEKVGELHDLRSQSKVEEEYLALMKESVRLRFRSDVPVGVNLSGGIDSSSLLALIDRVQKDNANVNAFTFTTGDERYDEIPWVRQMLTETDHPLIVSELKPAEVPKLAKSVQFHQDEPFAGLPTLAYAKLFETAREKGSIVLLDGNGMDEQWAGYDYYLPSSTVRQVSLVQGTKESPVRPECLTPEFRALAKPVEFPKLFSDTLRNLQYRDATYTKIPRAMRFNDRISMRSSVELREPFLDHRLFELAFRQPSERKIDKLQGKVTLRKIAKDLIGERLSEFPKRPIQTPQREWLRGELKDWVHEMVGSALNHVGGSWLDSDAVSATLHDFNKGYGDNSFFVWQWINLGLMAQISSVNYSDHLDHTALS